MQTWFRISRFGHTIEPVKVVRENDKSIVLSIKRFSLDDEISHEWVEQRQNKITELESYHPTLEDACRHLLFAAEKGVAEAAESLMHANDRLARVRESIAQATASEAKEA